MLSQENRGNFLSFLQSPDFGLDGNDVCFNEIISGLIFLIFK